MKAFFALLTCVLVATPGVVAAADPAVDPDEPTYELTLYGWGTALAGQIDTDKGEFDTHISFSDVWDNLNIAAMLRGRAQFGKFSVVTDVFYAALETDTYQDTFRLGPRGNLKVPASAELEFDQWIVELNGGYQILNTKGPFSAGPSDQRGTVAEIYAGGRYYALKPDVNLDLGAVNRELSDWEAWVDGIVGARIGIDLSKTVVLGIQGDVGGFNIGNSSKFAWSQITSLSWEFTDNAVISLGYKFLDFKRDVGDNEIDIQLRGPFVAGTVRF